LTCATPPPLPTEAQAALNFIEGALRAHPGLAVIRLKGGGKHPAERFIAGKKRRQSMTTEGLISLIRRWMLTGKSVGFVIYRAGLWVLDIDTLEALPPLVAGVLHELRPPEIQTPSGGRHCYFKLPEELVEHPDLKAHMSLRKVPGIGLAIDLKLGGRQTLVVAPGSKRSETGYLVIRPWRAPPELDPRQLFPAAKIFHPPQYDGEGREFIRDTRPYRDRVVRAMNFLTMTQASVSGNGGHRVLANVCAHVCGYLQIPKARALELLTSPPGASWNDRCKDGVTGASFPWTRMELSLALDAGQKAIPGYGVVMLEKERRDLERDQKLELACRTIRKLMPRGRAYVAVRDVYDVALKAMGMSAEDCTIVRFGRALRSAGVARHQKGPQRDWSVRVQRGLPHLEARLGEAFQIEGNPPELSN
jgi:hypothetical protein